MNQESSLLNEDEVIYAPVGRVLMPNPTFKVSEFLDALAQMISEQEAEWTEDCEGWFLDGLPCEALRFGNQGWQRGRVRIRLEFHPQPQKLLKEQSLAVQHGPVKNLTPAKRDIYGRTDDTYYREVEENY